MSKPLLSKQLKDKLLANHLLTATPHKKGAWESLKWYELLFIHFMVALSIVLAIVLLFFF